jgi:FixJ family two-component response regulator
MHASDHQGTRPLRPAESPVDDGLARATVFVVDDDSAVRAAISMLVAACGWQAVPCTSADDFLQRYSRAARQCLVLDLQMPGRSGVELQLALRQRGDDIPVIVVTAHHDHPDAERARSQGAQAVLGKPFRDHDLMRCIERALAAGAATPQQGAPPAGI